MYKSYYGMNTNPFIKEETNKYPFESDDYNEVINRLNYIKEINGIGIFYGENGLGKTYVIKSFIDSLNKDLYKIIYINSKLNSTVFDFLNNIAKELDLDTGNCYKTELTDNIQKEIIRIVNQDKMKVIVIIDDAHLLKREILLNLKILYDFEINTKDYVTLVLVGQEELKIELSKPIHNSLKQRINTNYKLNGLSRKEVKEYISTRLEIVNSNKEIFTEEALNTLYSCSKSSIRRLNTLIINCLMLGSQMDKPVIDEEIVRISKGEMDLK